MSNKNFNKFSIRMIFKIFFRNYIEIIFIEKWLGILTFALHQFQMM